VSPWKTYPTTTTEGSSSVTDPVVTVRIVHVTDGYLPRMGGIERQVHDLAERQTADGHGVEIVTAVAGPPMSGEVAIRRPRPEASATGARIRYEWAYHGCDRRLFSKADVVHVHASTWSPLTFLALGTAVRAGVPAVATLHSLWDYAAPLFAGADRLTRWSRWPVVWSAVSRVAAEPFADIVGSAARVHVVPNGVDPADWSRSPAERDDGTFRVVSVGRLVARKRPMALLKVLRETWTVLPSAVQLEAVLIGDGPARPALERYLARHGMRGWVRLAGALDRDAIADELARADAYVAPATLESFGIAALEARCAGLPVIGHAKCGLADFIEHDRDGLLGDGDAAMTRNLVRIATEPDLLRRITAYNRSVAPPADWPRVLRRWDELYEQAASLPRRDRSGVAQSAVAEGPPG
jgi:glycosyltransferase involved in cell wall biosynthesis